MTASPWVLGLMLPCLLSLCYSGMWLIDLCWCFWTEAKSVPLCACYDTGCFPGVWCSSYPPDTPQKAALATSSKFQWLKQQKWVSYSWSNNLPSMSSSLQDSDNRVSLLVTACAMGQRRDGARHRTVCRFLGNHRTALLVSPGSPTEWGILERERES